MPMRPDTFLLIVVTSGVCIFIVGIIIVVNIPLEALSCSTWYRKICEITKRRRRCCCRRKIKINIENCKLQPSSDMILSPESNKNYGDTLVQGRPQGHGFYTAGPWTSTDTCSTAVSVGVDAVQNITMMTQMGIFASAMMGTAGFQNSTSETSNSDISNRPLFYSNFLNSDSPEYGLQGDNSSALNSGGSIPSVCVNCEGSGFLNSPQGGHPALLHVPPVVPHQLVEGSSLASVSAVDSAWDTSDMNADADMMIMCM